MPLRQLRIWFRFAVQRWKDASATFVLGRKCCVCYRRTKHQAQYVNVRESSTDTYDVHDALPSDTELLHHRDHTVCVQCARIMWLQSFQDGRGGVIRCPLCCATIDVALRYNDGMGYWNPISAAKVYPDHTTIEPVGITTVRTGSGFSVARWQVMHQLIRPPRVIVPSLGITREWIIIVETGRDAIVDYLFNDCDYPEKVVVIPATSRQCSVRRIASLWVPPIMMRISNMHVVAHGREDVLATLRSEFGTPII